MSAASPTMRGLTTTMLVGAAMLMASAHADQAAIPRVGVLVYGLPYEQGLRDGLRELGYIEGKNIVIEWRRSEGVPNELRSLATDLARSKQDLIVVFGTPAALAAVKVATMPVVFLSSDPVASGLAASLARPGGNATGVSLFGPELTPKRLELLRMVAPRARRIGCLVNSSNPVGVLQFEQAQKAARALGVELVKLDARNDAELDAAMRAIPRSGVDEMLITGDSLFLANMTKIAEAMRKTRLPAMFSTKEFQGPGVLMSYGPSLRDAAREMSIYVDKILKGAKPGDLPIEQISKYELIIDLRVARELGLKLPLELLSRADEVIR